MNLVFFDDFKVDGAPDKSKWTIETGGHGGGNDELQYYSDELRNAYVENGRLILKALKEEYKERHYTSAKLITRGTFSFQYGKIEVVAKLPKGLGSWPAIWMLPDSCHEGVEWPLCGEIDIMEHVGKDENRVHASLHTATYNHGLKTHRTGSTVLENVTGQFHKYACVWTEDYVEFFYDDEPLVKIVKNDWPDTAETGWPFDQNFYLILNVAVGGMWGGYIDESALPYIMEVESVKIYQ